MRLRAGAAVVLLGGLLGGCALLKPEVPADAAPAPAPTGPPALDLVVDAPDDLATLLHTHLDLARLQRLSSGEPVSALELARLQAAAPAQARSLLETEGFFNAQVNVTQQDGNPPGVLVSVDPGPRARIDSLRLDVAGPLQDSAEAGNAAAREARDTLHADWHLPPGAAFRDAQWSEAKNAALAQLRAAGYATATWRETAARVDAQTNRVALVLVADSGPLFRTGRLRIQGLERQSEETVRNLADFKPGTAARESLLLDYQERLQKSGLFDRVAVTLDTRPANAEAATVTVRLHEQPLQLATVGVGISANTGPRVSLEHVHRRAFGLDATARNKLEWGGLQQTWDGELSSHTQPGLYRNLVGGAIERVESDTDVVTSASARVGRAQDTERIERLGFVEVERALVQKTGQAEERADALTLNYHGVWRDLDSVLLPTEGLGLALQGGVGVARSNYAEHGPFARAWGRLQFWRPLGREWYGQARLELGQVFLRDSVAIPDTQRFRAGGDDSVRGYGYRSLGPEVDGVVESGNMVFTGSLEIARPISEHLPSVWWAVFVDAGNAANRWSEIDPAVGAGLGLRWRSPVGPLRIDLAYGERVHSVHLYVSVGVAF
jgi:translocation and assembly module TamA